MSGILIETERLVLRSWREADRDPFAEMSLDPKVMAYLDGPMDRAASDALIDRLLGEAQQNGATFWAVERKGDGAFLGFCGLRREVIPVLRFQPNWRSAGGCGAMLGGKALPARLLLLRSAAGPTSPITGSRPGRFRRTLARGG